MGSWSPLKRPGRMKEKNLRPGENLVSQRVRQERVCGECGSNNSRVRTEVSTQVFRGVKKEGLWRSRHEHLLTGNGAPGTCTLGACDPPPGRGGWSPGDRGHVLDRTQ